jgi:hypothetical protein
MSKANSRTLLVRARALLSDREISTGACARNRHGDPCTPGPDAVALSPLGALMWAAREAGVPWYEERQVRNAREPTGPAVQAVKRLAQQLTGGGSPWCAVADFNDAQASQPVALALFDRALAPGTD